MSGKHANLKQETIEALALQVIEKEKLPNNYLNMIPSDLRNLVVGEVHSYDIDDKFDKLVMKVISKQPSPGTIKTNDGFMKLVRKARKKRISFLRTVANKAYYYRD